MAEAGEFGCEVALFSVFQIEDKLVVVLGVFEGSNGKIEVELERATIRASDGFVDTALKHFATTLAEWRGDTCCCCEASLAEVAPTAGIGRAELAGWWVEVVEETA